MVAVMSNIFEVAYFVQWILPDAVRTLNAMLDMMKLQSLSSVNVCFSLLADIGLCVSPLRARSGLSTLQIISRQKLHCKARAVQLLAVRMYFVLDPVAHVPRRPLLSHATPSKIFI